MHVFVAYICALEFIEQVFLALIIGETDVAHYYWDFLIMHKQTLLQAVEEIHFI